MINKEKFINGCNKGNEMGIVLTEDRIDTIESLKAKLDDSKLDFFVDKMFDNLVREAIFNAAIQDEDNEARKGDVVTQFNQAWDYGVDHYGGKFNLVILTDLAARMEPMLKGVGVSHALLRKGMTAIPGLQYVPPADEERIRSHLENVLSVTDSSEDRLHPVEEAVFLYFHLTRIQPFENGNKRTANAIMNLTLKYHGFPVVSIAPEERYTYAALLGSAIDGFRDSTANGDGSDYTNVDFQQRGFYDFLANKVIKRLTEAKDYLRDLPRYTLSVTTSNPGQVYAAKGRINNWFTRHGDGLHQVHLDRRSNTLDIVGEIPYEVLNCIASKQQFRSYELKTVVPSKED